MPEKDTGAAASGGWLFNPGQREISREESRLVAKVGGTAFDLFAESPTKFFAKTTDVQIEFPPSAQCKPDRLTWSVGEGANVAKRDK